MKLKPDCYWDVSLATLQDIVQDDLCPSGVAIAYLFAHTPENSKSILRAGVRIIRDRRARRLGICATGADQRDESYDGFERWRDELCSMGLQRSQIVPVQPLYDPRVIGRGSVANTLTESRGFIRYLRANHLRRAYVVAPPFHQRRAFITAVTALIQTPYFARIYNYPGDVQSFDEIVRHGQGETRMVVTRYQHSLAEMVRIWNYRQQGNLVSLREVFAYLRNRDGVVGDGLQCEVFLGFLPVRFANPAPALH